jgi:uncharacterized protein YbjQ (UPF0145 family)
MIRTGTEDLGAKGLPMPITTMNDVPGHKVTSVLGEVFGLTVRSRYVGSQFGAAINSFAGGELRG